MAEVNNRSVSCTSATRTCVAYLAEARKRGFASQSCPSFIRAFEGGVTDCGLNLGPEFSKGDPVGKLLFILEADDPYARFIPMKVKDIAPVADHKRNLYWVYTFTRHQVQHY